MGLFSLICRTRCCSCTLFWCYFALECDGRTCNLLVANVRDRFAVRSSIRITALPFVRMCSFLYADVATGCLPAAFILYSAGLNSARCYPLRTLWYTFGCVRSSRSPLTSLITLPRLPLSSSASRSQCADVTSGASARLAHL